MNDSTVYNSRNFLNIQFLRSVGLLNDEKKFFNSVSDVHKLKVIKDEDMAIAKQFASYNDATLVDWLIPVSSIQLSSLDQAAFEKTGYLNLIAHEKIANKLM